MATRDLRHALIEDLEEIEHSVAEYLVGRNSAYQGVCVQLRTMFIGYRRALINQVLPNASFHAFRPDEMRRTPGTVLYFNPRGFLKLGETGGARLDLQFSGKLLSVDAWLEQWILVPEVKVGRLIKEAAEDDVTHTNTFISRIVALADGDWQFGGRSEGRRMHRLAVVALGQYAAQRTRQLLAQAS